MGVCASVPGGGGVLTTAKLWNGLTQQLFSVGNLMLPDVVVSDLFALSPSILYSLPSASSAESLPLDLRGHLLQFSLLSAATKGQRGRYLELPGTLNLA